MMEHVTLTQQEQARLRVLNSLLAGQITLDQAADLMAVSSRHAQRMLIDYRDRGAASTAIATEAADQPTPRPRRWLPT